MATKLDFDDNRPIVSNADIDKEITVSVKQIGGTHYKDMAIQPIEFILANDLNFCEGNVIKYICRYAKKGGIEDLQKAKHYIDFLINPQEK